MKSLSGQTSIPPEEALDTARNCQELRRLGLEAAIRTGSDSWTDYNEHDPGITILEILSFVLTDLAYRTNFPIEDIIAQQKASAQELAAHQFYTARQVLTSSSVTLDDFRKILIDLDDVQNAWVRPWTSVSNPFGGLFEVLVDPTPQLSKELEPMDGLQCDLSPGMAKIIRRELSQLPLAGTPDTSHVSDALVRALLMIWNLPDTLGDELGEILNLLVQLPGPWTHALADCLNRLLMPNAMLCWEEKRTAVCHSVQSLLSCRLLSDPAWQQMRIHQALHGIVEAGKKRADLISRITQIFGRHRGMSRDVARVTLRKPVPVVFSLAMTLSRHADPEQTVATVFHRLERFLNPPVEFLPLDEMTAKCGGDVNRVFEGPPLRHGFLPSEALQEPRSILRATEIIEEIQSHPGVLSVSNLLIAALPQPGSASTPLWQRELRARSHERFQFAPLGEHQIQLSLNSRKLESTYALLRHQTRAAKLAPEDRDLPIPIGEFRELEHYVTIQQEFPRIYGVEPNGPPRGADEARIAQIRQLKSYLLFFDQILANYLAQLAHLGHLFSWNPSNRRTYFFQGLEDAVKSLDELALNFPLDLPSESPARAQAFAEAASKYRQKLAVFREDETTFLRRRNEFLNHLLSRFGRGWSDFTAALWETDPTERAETEVGIKLTALNQYCALSGGRGRAFASEPGALPDPQYSGLRRWIETLFSFEGETQAVRTFLHRFAEANLGDEGVDVPPVSRFVLKAKEGGAIDMKELMRIGTDETRYGIESPAEPEQGYRLVLSDATSPNPSSKRYELTESFSEPKQAIEARRELSSLLKRYDRASERVYILEHLLLRPGEQEPDFGLRLLDAARGPWLSTSDWYPQTLLAQIEPPETASAIEYTIRSPTGIATKTASRSTPVRIQTLDSQASSQAREPLFRFELSPVSEASGQQSLALRMRFGDPLLGVNLNLARTYASGEDAEADIDRWVGRAAVGENPSSLWAAFCRPLSGAGVGRVPDAVCRDPYSHVISAVIPTWPRRFQEERFCDALKETVQRESPSHLWINFVWLDHPEFQRYDRLFAAWWKAFSENGPGKAYSARQLLEFLLTPRLQR